MSILPTPNDKEQQTGSGQSPETTTSLVIGSNSKKRMIFNKQFALYDAILLLTGERDERFQQERTIVYFQFQAWAFAPRKRLWKRAAPLISARIIADKVYLTRGASRRSSALDRALRTSPYREIYQNYIRSRGGWIYFLRNLTPSEFDASFRKARDIELLFKLVDFRFRCIEHHASDLSNPSLELSKAFAYDPKSSGSSDSNLKGIWADFKSTAPFLYSYYHVGRKGMQPIRFKRSPDKIAKEANNIDRNKLLFGYAKYVDATLGGIKGQRVDFPLSVKTIRPETTGLSVEEIKRAVERSTERTKAKSRPAAFEE